MIKKAGLTTINLPQELVDALNAKGWTLKRAIEVGLNLSESIKEGELLAPENCLNCERLREKLVAKAIYINELEERCKK